MAGTVVTAAMVEAIVNRARMKTTKTERNAAARIRRQAGISTETNAHSHSANCWNELSRAGEQ